MQYRPAANTIRNSNKEYGNWLLKQIYESLIFSMQDDLILFFFFNALNIALESTNPMQIEVIKKSLFILHTNLSASAHLLSLRFNDRR